MFVLEYKINNGIWKVQYIHKLTYFVLHDVDFNSAYYFRISAMNAVGRGKPSKVFMVRIGGKLPESRSGGLLQGSLGRVERPKALNPGPV